jgi:hypothetical protein
MYQPKLIETFLHFTSLVNLKNKTKNERFSS